MGLISIALENRAEVQSRVERLLDEFKQIVIATARMDFHDPHKIILCVSVNTTNAVMGAITGKVGLLKGVRVKSFFW